MRQEARERAALEQGFTGHAELARETPFYEAMASVRLHLQKADEHLTVALSEVYVGVLLVSLSCLQMLPLASKMAYCVRLSA